MILWSLFFASRSYTPLDILLHNLELGYTL